MVRSKGFERGWKGKKSRRRKGRKSGRREGKVVG